VPLTRGTAYPKCRLPAARRKTHPPGGWTFPGRVHTVVPWLA